MERIPNIKPCQPFGPKVGEYIPAAATDIFHTINRERIRLNGQKRRVVKVKVKK